MPLGPALIIIALMNTESSRHDLRPFFTSLQSLVVLSESAKIAFTEAVHPKSFAKSDYLIRAGESDTGLYLIQKGLVRFVYLTEDGKEFNKSFAAEGEFVGCLLSMLTTHNCRFSIQALEACDTIFLSNLDRKRLFQRFPEWERLGRILAEQLALKKEAREAEFLLDSAEIRYQRFMTEHPDWIKRLPQYQIASYLGITDVALSRIRHKPGTATASD